MSDTKIERLLSEISVIQKHYEEIARLTGENFNVFKILNLSTSEVRTHSAFLAELLNPNGSHNQGAIYLQLFIDKMNSYLPDNNKVHGFVCDKAEVFVEKRIGTINENKTEGGNIDILIKDINGYEIVIENKINAGDQENQLIRYWNYIKEKNGILLYLNLDSHEASGYSTEDKNVNISLQNNRDYFVISYSDFIIEWLEECQNKSASLPIIRETIQQYIYLLKSLTGKSLNKTMTNKVAEIMCQNCDYVKSSFIIFNSIQDMKVLLMKELEKKFDSYASSNNLEYRKVDKDEEGTNYYKFYLTKNSDLYISYGFDSFPDKFFIGVRNDNEFKNNIMLEKIMRNFNYVDKQHGCWIYLHYFEGNLSNWNKDETVWVSIIEGTFFEDRLKQPLDSILGAIKSVN